MPDRQSNTVERKNFLLRIKDSGARLIYSKHMLWGIGVASFLEAIIVPIPLEAILIPLMQVRRQDIVAISTAALLGCMVGACVGYGVGLFVFDAVGDYLVNLISTPEQYQQAKEQLHAQGFLFVFSVGVIPIPFQIAMLVAGATQYSFFLFLLATLLSRGLRYYGLAALVWVVGNRAQELFERHKIATALVTSAVVAIIWLVVFFFL